jgi:hypothetical protein
MDLAELTEVAERVITDVSTTSKGTALLLVFAWRIAKCSAHVARLLKPIGGGLHIA